MVDSDTRFFTRSGRGGSEIYVSQYNDDEDEVSEDEEEKEMRREKKDLLYSPSVSEFSDLSTQIDSEN